VSAKPDMTFEEWVACVDRCALKWTRFDYCEMRFLSKGARLGPWWGWYFERRAVSGGK
jgi:hypothetical protein